MLKNRLWMMNQIMKVICCPTGVMQSEEQNSAGEDQEQDSDGEDRSSSPVSLMTASSKQNDQTMHLFLEELAKVGTKLEEGEELNADNYGVLILSRGVCSTSTRLWQSQKQ